MHVSPPGFGERSIRTARALTSIYCKLHPPQPLACTQPPSPPQVPKRNSHHNVLMRKTRTRNVGNEAVKTVFFWCVCGGGGRSLRPPIFFLPFCISDRRRSCKSTLFSTPGQSSALRLPRRKIRMTPSFLQKLTLKKEINSNFLPPPPLFPSKRRAEWRKSIFLFPLIHPSRLPLLFCSPSPGLSCLRGPAPSSSFPHPSSSSSSSSMLEKGVRPRRPKKNSFLLAERSVPEERGEEVGVPDSPKLYQIESTVLFNENKLLLLPFPQFRSFLSLPFLHLKKRSLPACEEAIGR